MSERRGPPIAGPVFDFRRNRDASIRNDYSRVITVDDMQRPESLRGVIDLAEVFGAAGGDGTLKTAMDFAARHTGVLAVEALGTTNTLVTALIDRYVEVPIPDHFESIFPKDDYTARTYHPPFAFVEDGQGTYSALAYLYGFCQLTVEINKLFDILRAKEPNRKIPDLYKKAALESVKLLLNPRFTPLQPANLSYEVKGQRVTVPDQFHFVVTAVSVSKIATLNFQAPISEDEVKLFILSGKHRKALTARYILTLAAGQWFSADTVIRLGLVESNDVRWLSVTPDTRHPKRLNVNIDGDVERENHPVYISRSPEVLQERLPPDIRREVTVIIRRDLL